MNSTWGKSFPAELSGNFGDISVFSRVIRHHHNANYIKSFCLNWIDILFQSLFLSICKMCEANLVQTGGEIVFMSANIHKTFPVFPSSERKTLISNQDIDIYYKRLGKIGMEASITGTKSQNTAKQWTVIE